jgi:hypothetical protein
MRAGHRAFCAAAAPGAEEELVAALLYESSARGEDDVLRTVASHDANDQAALLRGDRHA